LGSTTETSALGIDPVTTSHDSSIWHDGIAQQSFWATTDGSVMKIPQIGPSQISPIKTSNTDIYSITQVSISEISRNKLGTCQVSTSENSTSQIGTPEASTSQICFTEIGSNQVKKVQAGSSEVGSTQINTIQDIFGGIAPIPTIIVNPETAITQIDSTKISLPSSISAVQLLNSHLSHDNTSLLTSIYSTAQSIWHTNTDLNLNFNITNLPTGQLAEATINGYDTFNRPSSATITLDDDGNGVGWFIDTTPEGNSEFRAGVGGDYFTANSDSQAYGKYDLLTTILHEMGHTLGIINGYSEFDKYVRSNKFVTASGTEITLTPDGSHLDSTLYPYDLMNTSLKTGVRKLPSAMDWATIDGINAGFEELVSRLNY
jgi:hypothetical protein